MYDHTFTKQTKRYYYGKINCPGIIPTERENRMVYGYDYTEKITVDLLSKKITSGANYTSY